MKSYRPEIDGLRAIAVLPVIFFHAGFQSFSGGFVGVDIFLVISGYLITSIILSAKKEGTFSLGYFYERRARRILPALYFVIAVCIPFAWLFFLPYDMRNFSQSMAAITLFASNILFWWQSGYFAAAEEFKPLLHTWSLSVEEQYYAVFPVFMLLVWRLGHGRIMAILFVVTLGSLAAAHWAAYVIPSAAFFLLPMRAWELAIGALLAFHHDQRPSRSDGPFGQAFGLLGLGLIAFAIVAYDKDTPFPSLYALAPTAGTVLIIHFGRPTTLVGRFLKNDILVGIGLISYSAYLWHQPIFVFARYMSPQQFDGVIVVGLILLSFALAYFSWRFVERPFRNSNQISSRYFLGGAICIGFVYIVFGTIGHVSRGFENYYLSQRLTEDQKIALQIIKKHAGKDIYEYMVDNNECVFWSRRVTEEIEARYNQCARKYGPGVIVLGDSHAMNLHNLLAKAKTAPFLLGISQGGCRLHNIRPQCNYDGFFDFLRRNGPHVRGVIYHQSGAYLLQDRFGQVDSRYIFEADASFLLSAQNVQAIESHLNQLAEFATVKWFGPFVEARVRLNDYRILSPKMTLNAKSIEQFRSLDSALKASSEASGKRYSYQSLVDALDINETSLMVGDCITFNDTDHLSVCGEDLFAKLHAAKLQKMVGFN